MNDTIKTEYYRIEEGAVLDRKYCGKSTWDNKVEISFGNHKYKLIYIFKNQEEAEHFYYKFDFYGKKLSMFKYLKFKFCQHEDMYNLDCNSDMYYYKHCQKCNKAEYIDTESIEQKLKRKEKFNKQIKQGIITDLRNDITSKQRKLEVLTMKYHEEFGEEF